MFWISFMFYQNCNFINWWREKRNSIDCKVTQIVSEARGQTIIVNEGNSLRRELNIFSICTWAAASSVGMAKSLFSKFVGGHNWFCNQDFLIVWRARWIHLSYVHGRGGIWRRWKYFQKVFDELFDDDVLRLRNVFMKTRS